MGGSLEKTRLSHFFHAYLVPLHVSLQSWWHQVTRRPRCLGNAAGSCSYVRRLRATSAAATALLQPWQHGLLGEARLRLQKHWGQRRVRPFWSDSLSPRAPELPGVSFVLVVFLAGAGSVQSSTASGLGFFTLTLGDTLTSSEIALVMSLFQLKVDSQSAGQLLALPRAVLSHPMWVVKVAPRAWAASPHKIILSLGHCSLHPTLWHRTQKFTVHCRPRSKAAEPNLQFQSSNGIALGSGLHSTARYEADGYNNLTKDKCMSKAGATKGWLWLQLSQWAQGCDTMRHTGRATPGSSDLCPSSQISVLWWTEQQDKMVSMSISQELLQNVSLCLRTGTLNTLKAMHFHPDTLGFQANFLASWNCHPFSCLWKKIKYIVCRKTETTFFLVKRGFDEKCLISPCRGWCQMRKPL